MSAPVCWICGHVDGMRHSPKHPFSPTRRVTDTEKMIASLPELPNLTPETYWKAGYEQAREQAAKCCDDIHRTERHEKVRNTALRAARSIRAMQPEEK